MPSAMLTLIPAVEVADGRTSIRKRDAIRTEQDFGDAVADAQSWVDQGATWLHLADLDGGSQTNREVLQDVRRGVHKRARTQVAGGIADDAGVRWAFGAGFDQVVTDTSALLDPEWLTTVFKAHHGRLVAGLDVRGGKVYAPGTKLDRSDLSAALATIKATGAPGVVLTDIDLEDTRKGPDAKLIKAVAAGTGVPVCVAGGLERLEHLHELSDMMADGVVAAILDAALYEDFYGVAEALAAVEPRFDPYEWGPAQPWGLTQGL